VSIGISSSGLVSFARSIFARPAPAVELLAAL
jgi:hypothetical protein